MSSVLLVVPLAASLPARAACPTPFDLGDLNCDGADPVHCASFDLDGASFGDCLPNLVIDDFWTFYDGDFNGRVDPGDPDDIILQVPDGFADGSSLNPRCDRFSEDRAQLNGLGFLDSATLTFLNLEVLLIGHRADVVSGPVENLSFIAGAVDLGVVTCLGSNLSGSSLAVPTSPPSRHVFFYVVRWQGVSNPPGEIPYGFAGCTQRVVLPGNGDCI